MRSVDIFDEDKAAQAAAFFLFCAGGAMEMAVLKLMKLLYLAERRSFELYSEPIIGDRLVSMPHGPVLSLTFNHMNGQLESKPGGWAAWIGGRNDYMLGLAKGRQISSPEQDLLALSEVDLEIREEIWRDFGAMSAFQIRDYTHQHCPEWRDPNGSMIPMTFGDLFQALEFSDARARESLAQLEERATLDEAFKQAGAKCSVRVMH